MFVEYSVQSPLSRHILHIPCYYYVTAGPGYRRYSTSRAYCVCYSASSWCFHCSLGSNNLSSNITASSQRILLIFPCSLSSLRGKQDNHTTTSVCYTSNNSILLCNHLRFRFSRLAFFQFKISLFFMDCCCIYYWNFLLQTWEKRLSVSTLSVKRCSKWCFRRLM